MTGLFRAANITDAHGNRYCQLTLQTKDGSDGAVVKLPRADYILDLNDIIKLIPDYVVDADKKEEIEKVITFLGWDDIQLEDITKDMVKKDDCSMLNSYVNEKITEDDKESYPIPEMYLIIASSGLVVAAVVAFLMWRRII